VLHVTLKLTVTMFGRLKTVSYTDRRPPETTICALLSSPFDHPYTKQRHFNASKNKHKENRTSPSLIS
jgi:hypothetical protein